MPYAGHTSPCRIPGGGTGRCGTKGALVHAWLGAYGQQRVAAGGRLSSLEHPGGCREDWCFWSLKITRCWERAAGSARSTASASREREDVSAWKDGRRLDPPQATEEWSRVSLATGFQFFTPAPEHTGQQKKKHRKKEPVQDNPGTTRYQRTWVWCCSLCPQSIPSPAPTSLPCYPNPFQHVEDFSWGTGLDVGAPEPGYKLQALELAADAGVTHLTASSPVMRAAPTQHCHRHPLQLQPRVGRTR